MAYLVRSDGRYGRDQARVVGRLAILKDAFDWSRSKFKVLDLVEDSRN
jgi:hypothetical protein